MIMANDTFNNHYKPVSGRWLSFNRVLLLSVIALQVLILAKLFGKTNQTTPHPMQEEISTPRPTQDIDDNKSVKGATPHKHDANSVSLSFNYRPPRIFKRTHRPSSLFSSFMNDPSMNFHEEMDRMFQEAATDFQQMEEMLMNWDTGWSTLGMSPALDMREQRDDYVVIMGIPDMNISNISINLDGRLLTVSSRHDEQNPDQIRKARFERKLLLPGPVKDGTDVQTVFTNNILKIVIPKEDRNSTTDDNRDI